MRYNDETESAVVSKLLGIGRLLAVSVVLIGGTAIADEIPGGLLWLNPEAESLYFVPETHLASGQWEFLAVDDYCRMNIKGLIDPRKNRIPPPPKSLRRGEEVGMEASGAKSIVGALSEKPDVLLGRVVMIENGYSCWRVGVARRIDIEVEEVLRGDFMVGERVAIVEPGGHFNLNGRDYWALEESFFPPARIGDEVVIGGHRLSTDQISPFSVELHFIVEDGVILPAAYPQVKVDGPTEIEDLRALDTRVNE